MTEHLHVSDVALRRLIRHKSICFGGNRKLKIYGMLHCTSGKRMLRKNRVFFATENEAVEKGYRPCGHCMNKEYKNWKNGIIQHGQN